MPSIDHLAKLKFDNEGNPYLEHESGKIMCFNEFKIKYIRDDAKGIAIVECKLMVRKDAD